MRKELNMPENEVNKEVVTGGETAEPKPETKPETKAEPKPDNEVTKLKAALSRANSDAADWKRKYVASLDEAKKKELEAAEAAEADAKQRQAEREELEALKAYKRTNIYKERLLDAGYDLETASLMANSLPEGVGEEYFTAQKTFLQNQRKEADKAKLNSQPGLSVGMPPNGTAKSEEDAKYDRWFGL